jgi:hypothetical protein
MGAVPEGNTAVAYNAAMLAVSPDVSHGVRHA